MCHRIEDDDESRRQLKRKNGALVGENLLGFQRGIGELRLPCLAPRKLQRVAEIHVAAVLPKLSESGLCAEILRTLGSR